MKQTKVITYIFVILILLQMDVILLVNAAESNTYRYARISSLSGDVFVQASDEIDSKEARMNFPFLDGDRLITGDDGNAEIQFDNGIYGWVWHNSKLDLDQMDHKQNNDDDFTTLNAWIGEFIFRAQWSGKSEYSLKIVTPAGEIITDQSALFFVRVSSNSTEISLMDGTAIVSFSDKNFRIGSGESIRFNLAGQFDEAIELTADSTFYEWAIERDKLFSGVYDNYSHSEYYPDDAPVGTEELERYGKWVFNVEMEMWCWRPYVSIGWRPYHSGHWDYIPSWGWTWIPFEAWGWIPFHYGRWAYYFEFGWLWIPYWHWRPHWCAFQQHGRTIHWIPLHPNDKLNESGQLLEGSVPYNSQLELGVPIVASQSIDEMLKSESVSRIIRSPKISEDSNWSGNIPESLRKQALNHKSFKSDNRVDINSHSKNSYTGVRKRSDIRRDYERPPFIYRPHSPTDTNNIHKMPTQKNRYRENYSNEVKTRNSVPDKSRTAPEIISPPVKKSPKKSSSLLNFLSHLGKSSVGSDQGGSVVGKVVKNTSKGLRKN